MSKMENKVEVEVLVGTVDDGTGQYGPGEKLMMNEREAKALSIGSNPVVRLVTSEVGGENVVKLSSKKEGGSLNAEERVAAIVEAVTNLDPENKDHWLSDGETPDLEALSSITGFPVKAAERDAALKQA